MSMRTPVADDNVTSVTNPTDTMGSTTEVATVFGGTDYYGSTADVSDITKEARSERMVPKFIDRRLPPQILKGLKTKKKRVKNKKDSKSSLPLKDIENAVATELKEHRQTEEERILKEDQLKPHVELHLAYIKKETNLLKSLGRIYLERGKVTKDYKDFIKAAALYNSVLFRLQMLKEPSASIENVEDRLKTIETTFLKTFLGDEKAKNISQGKEQRHVVLLERLRKECEKELNELEHNCDPSTAGGDEEWQHLLKTKRVRATRCLHQNIADKLQSVMRALVEESVRVVGEPPCPFAVLGLGALAKQEITPYSEIEFAIIMGNSESLSPDQCKKYFRVMTAHILIKMLALRETPIHTMGIKSLNDLLSPYGDWYFDPTTPRGFTFDSFVPWASRTPLGREAIGKKKPVELIGSPEEMALLLNELSNDVDCYPIADSLRHACFIAGDRSLEIDYQSRKAILFESSRTTMRTDLESLTSLTFPTVGGERARSKLLSLVTNYTMGIEGDKKRYTIGKDLRNFLNIVYGIADYFGAPYDSPWDTVDELRRMRILSPEATTNLHVIISFIMERRLRHHVRLHTADVGNESKAIFDTFTDVEALFRFYNVMLPLCEAVQRTLLSNSDEYVDKRALKGNPLFDNSPQTRALIHLHLKQFTEAEICLRQILEETPDDNYSLLDIICVIFKTGKLNKTDEKPEGSGPRSEVSESIKDVVKRRQYKKNVSPRSRILKDATFNYNTTGMKFSPRSIIPKQKLGDTSIDSTPRSVKSFHSRDDDKDPKKLLIARLGSLDGLKVLLKQAETYFIELFEGNCKIEATPRLAVTFNNLAVAWYHFGDPRKTLTYFQRALQLWKDVYADNIAHYNITDTLNKIGQLQSELGKPEIAVTFHYRALELLIRLTGGNKVQPDIATTLNFLGNVYRAQNVPHKALPCYDEAIHIFRRIHQDQVPHPDVALTLDNLGCIWASFGESERAKTYHSMALDMYSNSTSAISLIQIADCLCHVGDCHRSDGDSKDAVTHYARALNLYEYIFGKEIPHSRIAKARCQIGKVWESLGEHKDAISYFEQALAVYKKVYMDDYPHPAIASTYGDMGNAFDSSGDYRKAISFHEKALSIFRRLYGMEAVNINVAKTLSDLGNASFAMGDSHNSISYHERALKMCRKIFGEKTAHPHIASSLVNLGSAWGTLGEYRKTVEYLEEALDMYRRIFGKPRPMHPDVSASLSNLGNALDALGEPEKAVTYHEEALEMKIKIYGDDVAHRDIAWSLNNLGNAFDSLKNYEKATAYYQQALDMKVRLYGSETPNPDVSRSMHNIGSTLDKMGRHVEALKYMEAALGMYSHILPYGAVHPDVAQSLYSMGLIQTHVGQPAKAILYHKESLIMKRLLFGEDSMHPDIIQSLKELAFLYCTLGDYDTGMAYFDEAVEMAKTAYGESHAEYETIKSMRDDFLLTHARHGTRSN